MAEENENEIGSGEEDDNETQATFESWRPPKHTFLSKKDMCSPKEYPVSGCYSGGEQHPIQRLQSRAEELSGVSYEMANEIDNVNMGEIIGEFNMMQISESFAKKCFNDKDDWFSTMFSGNEEFVASQNEFFLQRFGGPSYYSDRKGNPSLIHRHASFEMSERTAERWLDYMEETLEEFESNKDISGKQKKIMMNYFRHTAYFLVASQEAMKEMSEDGPVPPNTDYPSKKECPVPTYSQLESDALEEEVDGGFQEGLEGDTAIDDVDGVERGERDMA